MSYTNQASDLSNEVRLPAEHVAQHSFFRLSYFNAMDRGGYARGATPEFNMNVVKIATDELALTNYVCIAPGQLDPARDKYLILDDEYVFTAR